MEESKEETKGEVNPQQEEQACLEYMNSLLLSNQHISLSHYREQVFSSVHIGDFHTTSQS